MLRASGHVVVEAEDGMPVDPLPERLDGGLVDRLAQIEPADLGADMRMQLSRRERHDLSSDRSFRGPSGSEAARNP